MKKITLLLLLFSLTFQVTAQVLNQPANWPNTNWVVTGTYSADPTAFEADPTLTANFAYDDDDAGSAVISNIEAESPVIDLTAAFTAGETWLFVNSSYVFNNINTDTLGAEYWDADAGNWIPWLPTIQADTAGAPTNNFCTGTPEDFQTDQLDISNFTTTQLSGFKYRIAYDDGGGWQWGFCFQSPTITSQMPPSCVNPSNLSVANIAGTSADFSWVAGASETSWEYVIQTAGMGLPTAPGMFSTATTINLNTLNYSTAYEGYVRANCAANGFSDWVGPLNFTTTVQMNFDVDCNLGAQTVNYCYTSNDTNFFTFTSSDGSALSITFNSGQVENNWDELIVLDSDGTTDLNAATPYGNGGDLAGVTYQSTGDTITFTIQSDGSISCETSGYTPIDVSVVCATCTNPTATYAVVSDCVNGPQFFVETDVTNLGSATSLTVADNQGNSQQVSATGIVSFGPYANTTDVIITTSSDSDANCSLTSTPLTQEICLDYSVDCNVGPTNFAYCYENNDPNIFTFTSTDGTPLNFTINAGFVENNWDELVVLDSDGTTDLNAATPYGNGGDVTGISYQSTGDTISFTITSDGVFGCQTNGYVPLDITVSCATCTNPTATYQVIDDCANGDQFLVGVNITSLGDAMSLEIEDNQGNPPVSVSTTGITQFGPYPFLTDIVFTTSNEQDINCVIISPAIQLLACPPDNDNCVDATMAQVNGDDTCTVTTPGTIVEATPSGDPVGSCAGNPDDDVWFEFTALDEVEVISLLNIVGGTNNLDFALYEGNCGALVELQCYNATAGVTPLLTVGNTYFIRVFSGGSVSETSTFDLCIQKAPAGTICENAGGFCNDGGTQTTGNITGFPSSGTIACLNTTPNPSWNIIQVGDPGLIEIEINQVSATGNGLDVDYVLWGPFASGDDFCSTDVLDQDCGAVNCPNNTTDPNFYPSGNIMDCSYSIATTENLTIDNALSGEIYVLLVTNFSNNPGEIQIQQTNTGPAAGTTVVELEVEIASVDASFIDDDNDETTPSVASLCGPTETTICATSPFADTYEWYKNGIFIVDEDGDCIVITESDTYTVIAYDLDCEVNAQDTVIVNFYQEAVANQAENIITCDDESADGIEDFDLDAQTATILGTQSASDFVVTYHAILFDAQSGMNALTSLYNAMDGTIIYVRVEDVNAVGSNSGCANTSTSFTLEISGPLPFATSSNIELCDDESRDGFEAFDLDLNDALILNGQDPVVFDVIYFETEMDAMIGMNPLPTAYTNTSNPQTIYARVENTTATDCFKITPFDLIVNDIPVTSFSSDFDYEVCPNATVPVIITATPDNYSDADVTITWYNEGVLIAGQNNLSIDNVLTAGTYTIEVIFNDTGCSSMEDIYIEELETCVISQGISPNGDGLNDTFDLSSYDVQSLQIFNRNGRLVYEKTDYLDEWKGQSLDGDELPVGTYYYIMNYQGTKTKAAWIYLNK